MYFTVAARSGRPHHNFQQIHDRGTKIKEYVRLIQHTCLSFDLFPSPSSGFGGTCGEFTV